MKKRRKRAPSLFDRFCTKFGPSILKVCCFIDKQTHGFFECLTWIITGGAYQPRPYKEAEETKKDTIFSVSKRTRFVQDDIRAIMGDFHSVGRDVSKAIRRLEHQNPEVTKAMQEAKNSPQFQKQVQEVQKRMNEVQQRCDHIRHVCSHSTTVGTGNTSEHERIKS
ncbi:MAG: hypothetical protein IKV03_00960 [Alphaproteobacteria bacterium]|nr:hypothetical protein [Alphaproteobacteria bacterium]